MSSTDVFVEAALQLGLHWRLLNEVRPLEPGKLSSVARPALPFVCLQGRRPGRRTEEQLETTRAGARARVERGRDAAEPVTG